jgi:hypothetical protein
MPSLSPVLNHNNPVRTTPSSFSKIHFNIIVPPTSLSSQWSLSFCVSRQIPICIPFLSHACHITCPSFLPLTVLLVITICEVHKLQTSCRFIFGINVLLSALFSNALRRQRTCLQIIRLLLLLLIIIIIITIIIIALQPLVGPWAPFSVSSAYTQ